MTRELPERVFKNDEPPPRKTSLIFKLLGLLLVLAAAWLGWYAYRTGQVPDLTDAQQQQKILDQARKDLSVAEEKATEYGGKAATAMSKAVDWTQRGIEDIRMSIKGKPPESKEEVSALVKDSSNMKTPPPAPPRKETAEAPPAPWDNPLQEAWNEYYRGVAEHSKSDPGQPFEQVQAALKAAAPHFERTLNLLEDARTKGGPSEAIEELEEKAAKRLYDCRKRRTLNLR